MEWAGLQSLNHFTYSGEGTLQEMFLILGQAVSMRGKVGLSFCTHNIYLKLQAKHLQNPLKVSWKNVLLTFWRWSLAFLMGPVQCLGHIMEWSHTSKRKSLTLLTFTVCVTGWYWRVSTYAKNWHTCWPWKDCWIKFGNLMTTLLRNSQVSYGTNGNSSAPSY